MCLHFLMYWPAQNLQMVTVPDSSNQQRNLRLGNSRNRKVSSPALTWGLKQSMFQKICELDESSLKKGLPLILKWCEHCNQQSGADLRFDVNQGVDSNAAAQKL